MKHIFHRRTHERNDIMRKFLKYIADNKQPSFNSAFEIECFDECVRRKYVTGFEVNRTSENGAVVEILENRFVTYDGILFLENKHPGWQTTLNTVLGVVSLIFSALSLILVFLSNFFDIGEAFAHLF